MYKTQIVIIKSKTIICLAMNEATFLSHQNSCCVYFCQKLEAIRNSCWKKQRVAEQSYFRTPIKIPVGEADGSAPKKQLQKVVALLEIVLNLDVVSYDLDKCLKF